MEGSQSLLVFFLVNISTVTLFVQLVLRETSSIELYIVEGFFPSSVLFVTLWTLLHTLQHWDVEVAAKAAYNILQEQEAPEILPDSLS